MRRWREGDVEYTRVTVRGVVEHEKERYLYAPHQRYGPGYDVFAPLKVGDARYVWVNLGYVPERFNAPETRPGGQAGGEVELVGIVRLSAVPGAFTPENDVQANLWYWRDLQGMHASAFDPEKTELVPFFIEAEPRPEGAGGPEWPKPGASTVIISNRHLEYALTWYGLALTLVGVYVAFAWHRLKGRRNPS
jgi:surfeit locus 1 family protein